MIYYIVCFFFFFQAEDGIRDVAVTGVQTCALPISLEVPQYDRARLLARHFLDRVGDLVADSAEALVLGIDQRSEERRVGKGVDLGGRRIIKKKKRREKW